MKNTTIRRLVGWIGTGLVFLICAVVIALYFILGRNLQRIDVSRYTNVTRNEEGGYDAELDVDRMIFEEHLSNPPAAELENYPEIEVLRALLVKVTESGGEYELQVYIQKGKDPGILLEKHGIKLTNTRWKLSAEEIEKAAQRGANAGTSGEIELNFSDYVCTERMEDGTYRAAVDTYRMLVDANIDPAANPETDLGARSLRSLGISCEKTEDGYDFKTISSTTTIEKDLETAGLRIVKTQWTWTEAEMEAHLGSVTPLPTPKPIEPEAQAGETPETTTDTPSDPSVTPPSATDTPAPTTPAPTTPSGTFNDVPGKTPAATPARSANAIDTLYGFDQTDVRKAIRAAKEQKYGSGAESEVSYNYFAVGDASTAHANVFRIVYSIKKSGATEYLIADVYDLEKESGYSTGDVYLKTAASVSAAKSTEGLEGYTVHTLQGGSMVFPENAGRDPFDADGLVMAKSLEEKVSYDELWDIPQTKDRTLHDLLGFARNEMFARAGNEFKTGKYSEHYKKYSWYKPTGKVSADDLAKKYPATKDNIATIKFLEDLIKNG